MSEKVVTAKLVETPVPALPALSAISAEQMVSLVSAAVVSALAAQPQGQTIPDNLGTVIGDAVAAGMTKNQRRKVTIGEYIARLKAGRPEMARRFYVNNVEMLPGDWRITPAEINLLNTVNRTGRYINRLVEVVIGAEGSEEVVHFRYNNRKPDHQFALMSAGVRDFGTMLQMIVEAQKIEAAEEEAEYEARGPRRRSFGNTKGTRAAEAAAATV